jgi:hypothetical protein
MDDTIRVKTRGEVWGVFYDNSPELLLMAVFETEEEARDYVEEVAQRAADEAVEAGDSDEIATMKYFSIMDRYDVDPIPAEVVDYDLLLRGFAQKFVYRQ